MEIFRARMDIFIKTWNQFCVRIIEEEKKRRKTKNKLSDAIFKIPGHKVKDAARKFVQSKTHAAIRAYVNMRTERDAFHIGKNKSAAT